MPKQLSFDRYKMSLTTLGLILCTFIIKFPYNACSDWLEQRALSENGARVDDIKLAFKFLLRNFDKFDSNKTSPVHDSGKSNVNELFRSSKYGSRKPLLTTVV